MSSQTPDHVPAIDATTKEQVQMSEDPIVRENGPEPSEEDGFVAFYDHERTQRRFAKRRRQSNARIGAVTALVAVAMILTFLVTHFGIDDGSPNSRIDTGSSSNSNLSYSHNLGCVQPEVSDGTCSDDGSIDDSGLNDDSSFYNPDDNSTIIATATSPICAISMSSDETAATVTIPQEDYHPNPGTNPGSIDSLELSTSNEIASALKISRSYVLTYSSSTDPTSGIETDSLLKAVPAKAPSALTCNN